MYKNIKRTLDFCLALIALAILFIPLAVVAIAIKLDSKGPVIFKQERLGKDGNSGVCVWVRKEKEPACIPIKAIHVLRK